MGECGVLLAVSDGMGGARAGEVASAMVIESMRRSMTMPPGTESCNPLVEQAAERANREVWLTYLSTQRSEQRSDRGAQQFFNSLLELAEPGEVAVGHEHDRVAVRHRALIAQPTRLEL